MLRNPWNRIMLSCFLLIGYSFSWSKILLPAVFLHRKTIIFKKIGQLRGKRMFHSLNEEIVEFFFLELFRSDLSTVQILNNIASSYLGTPHRIHWPCDVFGMSSVHFIYAFIPVLHFPQPSKVSGFILKIKQKENQDYTKTLRTKAVPSTFNPLINTHVMTLVEKKV